MARSRALLCCLGVALAALLSGGVSAAPAVALESQEDIESALPAEDVGMPDVVPPASSPSDGLYYANEISCGDAVCSEPVDCDCVIYTSFEVTFVQPRFGNNTAFTVMQSDGTSFENFSDTEFDYDFDFAPRMIAGLEYQEGIGVRATWWQYDHDATGATSQPPANGFGAITHPPFGDVDISTTIPGSTFTAATGLNAYAIDVEITKQASFAAWDLGVAFGVRYANVDQFYFAETTDSGDDLVGRINFQHETEGIGPTLSLSGSTPLMERIDLFGRGRGALLFGDASAHLDAGEDLDLSTPFTTTRSATSDDLLPFGELQLGARWNGSIRRGTAWRPFATVAMEGQFWNGAGSAASEVGDLAFFGLVASGGIGW